MKKILLLSTMIIIGWTNTNAQIRFAAEKGITLNNLSHNSFFGDERAKVGFLNHVLMNVPLFGGFSLQPGIGYTMKGAEIWTKTDNGTTSISDKNKLTLNYVEVPVNLIYSFGYPDEGHLFVGAGPYVARLVSARIKNITRINTEGQDEVVNKDIHELILGNANNSTAVTRVDFGVNALAGYQFAGRIYVKAGGSVGFRDLNSGAEIPFDGKNVNVSLTVGRVLGCHCR
jgi:hypothetical protein